MQQPDSKPGAYYVSVVDGPQTGLLLGPFVNDHAGALAQVDAVRRKAETLQPKAVFYSFGTVRADLRKVDGLVMNRPGLLNEHFPDLNL